MVYQFSRFDRESNRELWRWRSPVSLRVEWLAAWLKREHAARFGYRAWLYVQVSSGDMIRATCCRGVTRSRHDMTHGKNLTRPRAVWYA